MTSEELCEHLATHFNGLANKPLEYRATKEDDIAVACAERSDWQVFLVPNSENEEPPLDGAGMCREELIPSVVVNGPCKSVTRGKGIELQKFLRDSLKATEFEDYVWDGNEVNTLWDVEAFKKAKQFLSLFRPTYFTFA